MYRYVDYNSKRLPATGSRLPYQGKITCAKQANYLRLFNNAGNNAGSNGPAAFTDSEAKTCIHCDGSDEFDFHANVVAGHNHFNTLGELDNTGNVGGPEIELGTIAGEEGGMTAAFFLGQNVNLGIEVSVGVDGTGLCQNLTTLNLGPLDTAEKSTDVVACDRLIEELTEHFNAGNNGLLGFAETDDLNGIVYLYNTALNTTGCNGAAAGDGEYVLNGHKEGLVGNKSPTFID